MIVRNSSSWLIYLVVGAALLGAIVCSVIPTTGVTLSPNSVNPAPYAPPDVSQLPLLPLVIFGLVAFIVGLVVGVSMSRPIIHQ